ncbi:PHF7 protein, partial [Rhinopomastus cyanomelas]|nr:PHF7 protein [Rhinopomastus cyanomelas]
QECFVCRKSGAAITCSEMGCNRSFHLPCASEGGCVTQHLPHYRSFCYLHRPEQAVEAAPEANTKCTLCFTPVEEKLSYCTMVCPVCKYACFHRDCIQELALFSGSSCFQCPRCQDNQQFVFKMMIQGIQVPLR